MGKAIAVIIGVSIMVAVPQTALAHGGGPESVVTFGAVVNSLHFIATAFWLGGIALWRIAVTPSVRGRGEASWLMNVITIRFTHLVWWCIAILALTGVLTTWIHVPSTATLTGSAYGIILIGKMVLAAGMIACNAAINIGLARRSRRHEEDGAASARSISPSPAGRWVAIASHASVALAFLMMVSIAALVEFDRSLWNVALNFLRLSALTVWFGATAFLPLVLAPSFVGLAGAGVAHLKVGILRRYDTLLKTTAIVAIAATVLTALKNLESPSGLWTTGYGIVTSLQLLALLIMAVVFQRGRTAVSQMALPDGAPASPAIAHSFLRAVGAANANVVLGLAALFLTSLAAITFQPKDPTLAGQIPMATSSLSFDLLEPLGYIVAATVSFALIWYFGVVEGKVPKRNPDEESGV